MFTKKAEDYVIKAMALFIIYVFVGGMLPAVAFAQESETNMSEDDLTAFAASVDSGSSTPAEINKVIEQLNPEQSILLLEKLNDISKLGSSVSQALDKAFGTFGAAYSVTEGTTFTKDPPGLKTTDPDKEFKLTDYDASKIASVTASDKGFVVCYNPDGCNNLEGEINGIELSTNENGELILKLNDGEVIVVGDGSDLEKNEEGIYTLKHNGFDINIKLHDEIEIKDGKTIIGPSIVFGDAHGKEYKATLFDKDSKLTIEIDNEGIVFEGAKTLLDYGEDKVSGNFRYEFSKTFLHEGISINMGNSKITLKSEGSWFKLGNKKEVWYNGGELKVTVFDGPLLAGRGLEIQSFLHKREELKDLARLDDPTKLAELEKEYTCSGTDDCRNKIWEKVDAFKDFNFDGNEVFLSRDGRQQSLAGKAKIISYLDNELTSELSTNHASSLSYFDQKKGENGFRKLIIDNLERNAERYASLINSYIINDNGVKHKTPLTIELSNKEGESHVYMNVDTFNNINKLMFEGGKLKPGIDIISPDIQLYPVSTMDTSINNIEFGKDLFYVSSVDPDGVTLDEGSNIDFGKLQELVKRQKGYRKELMKIAEYMQAGLGDIEKLDKSDVDKFNAIINNLDNTLELKDYIDSLKEEIKGDDSDFNLLLEANALSSQGKIDEALEKLSSVKGYDSDATSLSQLLKADLLASKGDEKTALKIYEELMKVDSEKKFYNKIEQGYHGILAKQYEEEGDKENAIKSYVKAGNVMKAIELATKDKNNIDKEIDALYKELFGEEINADLKNKIISEILMQEASKLEGDASYALVERSLSYDRSSSGLMRLSEKYLEEGDFEKATKAIIEAENLMNEESREGDFNTLEMKSKRLELSLVSGNLEMERGTNAGYKNALNIYNKALGYDPNI